LPTGKQTTKPETIKIMRNFILILFFILWFCIESFAQTNLNILPQIKLPDDSVISNNLVSGLSDLLDHTEADNIHIETLNKALTLDLLDEIKEIEKSDKYKNEHFYKPYLINFTQISDTSYFIQLSYIGIDSGVPDLRANFDLLGFVSKSKIFTFSSPIILNTSTWKEKKTGDLIFHYKKELNNAIVDEYIKKLNLFDSKLGNQSKTAEIYCCTNASEALNILGVPYKSDYNGRNRIYMSYAYGNQIVIVSNLFGDDFSTFDPHDLFHERAALAIPSEKANRYMICGCAYLYGGSWGISWEEILKIFKAKMTNNKNTDWLKLYDERYNFGESKEKHLLVTQFINALIIQKFEKEKGFQAVMELLSSGDFRKDRNNFFKILEKITGINEKNFNREVSKLIRDAM
jgi:hypothetical protein